MGRLLDVRDLFAGYGPIDVLRGISIHLDAGENIGLFGPNGHGKTTLLQTISGLVRPTSGTITFNGADITTAQPPKIVEAGLVQSPQGNTMFGEMRVQETLELAAFSRRARGKRNDNLRRVFGLFPRLQERGNQRSKTLSGGERQMLSIGAALMCEPGLLMMDEPTLGLSPRLKEELSEAIGKIASDGVPLIVVEQDIEFLLRAADRLYLIEHGEAVQEIDRANAPDHAEIMELYFGKAGA
ncbi:MAG: ABC transporter ATP-binding protein [Hyphomicrobiales bacterium]|nr:ABC transporter ATP-binding protein [Hyphomicrobiales bacterium]MCP4997917.1 ABC transporter ATP-binding protein [Hyphomicrobiales bacterium]